MKSMVVLPLPVAPILRQAGTGWQQGSGGHLEVTWSVCSPWLQRWLVTTIDTVVPTGRLGTSNAER
jgi:hypothetical protein